MVDVFEVHHQPLFSCDDDDCDRVDYSQYYFHYLSMQFPKDYSDAMIYVKEVLLATFDEYDVLVAVGTNCCSDYLDDLLFDVLRQ